MKVFKFGGASVKDAAGVKNLAAILELFREETLVVVISAMGKTTNALERVVNAHCFGKDNARACLEEVRLFHQQILDQLSMPVSHPVRQLLSTAMVEIEWILDAPQRDYAWTYDQVVSQGELLSTRIVSAYLDSHSTRNTWFDIRDCLVTDHAFREARVNWELTRKLSIEKIAPLLKAGMPVITQGFIGVTPDNDTTTLGREGSDYTAAILSHCLDAREMIVWKDVPGVLSADPKFSDDAVKLEQISYHDAIELTYYGATVIHPKTIKPLENKAIPMRVRSFEAPNEKGSSIGNYPSTKPLVPSFIFKTDQILFSISVKDFSFIAEEHLSTIFGLFARHKVKMNLMQNSAISFSACVDNDPFKIPGLLEALKQDFRVLYNDGLRLITVRHYYPSTMDSLTKGKTVLLEQRSRQTAQVVLKESD